MNYTHVLTELHGWKLPLVRWLHTLCACVLPAAVHVFCALSGQEPADEKIKITIVVMYSNDIFKSSDLFRYIFPTLSNKMKLHAVHATQKSI